MVQCDLYRKTLDQKFNEYHAANPHVFAEFIKMAMKANEFGRKRIGAKFLLEMIRWNTKTTAEGDEFKVNNSYVSRYVRLLGSTRPDLAHLFAMRKIKP